MSRKVFLSLICSALVGVGAATAQPVTTPASARTVLSQAEVVGAAPPGHVVSEPGVQFTAGTDGATVSLKWALDDDARIPGGSLPEGILRGGATFTSWAITAEAPIKKTETDRTLLSLDGFTNATTIGTTYFRFMTDWKTPTAAETARRAELCADLKKKARELHQKDVDCTGFNYSQYLPERLQEARSLFPGPTPGGWLYGASAKVGVQDSKYFDAVTLAESTRRGHPWSLGVFGGWVPANFSTAMLLLKVDRKRTIKDADEGVRCPQSSTFPVQCVSGAIGAPAEKTGTAVTFDARWLVSTKLAVSLAVSRDSSRDVTAVELPVYFMRNAAGGLTGGIKLNWSSEEKKTGVAVFVGVPFGAWD